MSATIKEETDSVRMTGTVSDDTTPLYRQVRHALVELRYACMQSAFKDAGVSMAVQEAGRVLSNCPEK